MPFENVSADPFHDESVACGFGTRGVRCPRFCRALISSRPMALPCGCGRFVYRLRNVEASSCNAAVARTVKAVISRSALAQRFGLHQKLCECCRLGPQIIRSMFPFILFLIIFGLNNHIHVQPVLGDLGRNVHLSTINRLEQSFFACHPHKIISGAWHPALDFVAAVPYLLHYTIPILFPVFLFLSDRITDVPRFYWLLGVCSWVLYAVWWLFPHAPPWVMLNLSEFLTTSVNDDTLQRVVQSISPSDLPRLMAHKEGIAFRRLDEMTGHRFFFNLFTGSPVPFACFPSGHLAWSFTVFMIGGPGGKYFFIYVIWMGWATMYTFHHYLLDVFAGMLAVLVCSRWMRLVSSIASSASSAASVSSSLPWNPNMVYSKVTPWKLTGDEELPLGGTTGGARAASASSTTSTTVSSPTEPTGCLSTAPSSSSSCSSSSSSASGTIEGSPIVTSSSPTGRWLLSGAGRRQVRPGGGAGAIRLPRERSDNSQATASPIVSQPGCDTDADWRYSGGKPYHHHYADAYKHRPRRGRERAGTSDESSAERGGVGGRGGGGGAIGFDRLPPPILTSDTPLSSASSNFTTSTIDTTSRVDGTHASSSRQSCLSFETLDGDSVDQEGNSNDTNSQNGGVHTADALWLEDWERSGGMPLSEDGIDENRQLPATRFGISSEEQLSMVGGGGGCDSAVNIRGSCLEAVVCRGGDDCSGGEITENCSSSVVIEEIKSTPDRPAVLPQIVAVVLESPERVRRSRLHLLQRIPSGASAAAAAAAVDDESKADGSSDAPTGSVSRRGPYMTSSSEIHASSAEMHACSHTSSEIHACSHTSSEIHACGHTSSEMHACSHTTIPFIRSVASADNCGNEVEFSGHHSVINVGWDSTAAAITNSVAATDSSSAPTPSCQSSSWRVFGNKLIH